jgi:hypothetical protein
LALEGEWHKLKIDKTVYKVKADKPLTKLLHFDDIIRNGEGLYIPTEEEKRKEEQRKLAIASLGKVHTGPKTAAGKSPTTANLNRL